MSLKPILMDTGTKEPNTSIRSPAGAEPQAVYVNSPANESLDDLATRVYGFNTRGARDMIRRANSKLDGLVRIPKS